MSGVINSAPAPKANILLQGYLYLVRASMRLENERDAEEFMRQASLLNEKDAAVVETKHFLNFWLLVKAVNTGAPTSKAILARTENALQREPAFIRKQYESFLARVKARI